MQISSLSSAMYQPAGDTESLTKMKQLFQNLGTAVNSGNLTDAKAILDQLQAAAPTQGGTENNPVSASIEALSSAVESGDVKAAQDAYADVKKTMSQRPAASAQRSGGARGAPAGESASGGAGKSGSASGSSSSSQVYDEKDTNKDGEVSWQEELAYSLKHPAETEEDSGTAKTDSNTGQIDTTA